MLKLLSGFCLSTIRSSRLQQKKNAQTFSRDKHTIYTVLIDVRPSFDFIMTVTVKKNTVSLFSYDCSRSNLSNIINLKELIFS